MSCLGNSVHTQLREQHHCSNTSISTSLDCYQCNSTCTRMLDCYQCNSIADSFMLRYKLACMHRCSECGPQGCKLAVVVNGVQAGCGLWMQAHACTGAASVVLAGVQAGCGLWMQAHACTGAASVVLQGVQAGCGCANMYLHVLECHMQLV
jgi:hypothetical protein